MKKFSTKKASIPLSVKKLPWYVGIPLIVVFAPILVLITAGVLLYAWIVGSKTSKEPIQQYTWKDWTRNDAFRMRVRPLRPKEFSHIADEWFNHIDTEEQSLLLYAETQPPVSPLHGSVISNFCHETEDGFFVQRIWHVEEADPAIHSELIFIQPQEGSTHWR